jgi:hypothetical protein
MSLSAVMIIYDHALTLAEEVKFIWAAKFRMSIYWFLALRYFALAANITISVIYFVELSPEVRVPLLSSVQILTDLFLEVCIRIDVSSFVFKYPRSSCLQMQILWKVIALIQETLVECASGPLLIRSQRALIRFEFKGTLIMRVFAMYGRNWWIFTSLAVVSIPWVTFALVRFLHVFYLTRRLTHLHGVVGSNQGGKTADIVRAGDWVCCGISSNMVNNMTVLFT